MTATVIAVKIGDDGRSQDRLPPRRRTPTHRIDRFAASLSTTVRRRMDCCLPTLVAQRRIRQPQLHACFRSSHGFAEVQEVGDVSYNCELLLKVDFGKCENLRLPMRDLQGSRSGDTARARLKDYELGPMPIEVLVRMRLLARDWAHRVIM
jgi:hypothetical protein